MDSDKDTNRYENQKKYRLRGLGKMMVAVTVILFLLFFSIFLPPPVKPELIGWENGRPIDNTFKTRWQDIPPQILPCKWTEHTLTAGITGWYPCQWVRMQKEGNWVSYSPGSKGTSKLPIHCKAQDNLRGQLKESYTICRQMQEIMIQYTTEALSP